MLFYLFMFRWHELDIYIIKIYPWKEEEICYTDLVTFPQFLRLHRVTLHIAENKDFDHAHDFVLMKDKCYLSEMYLQAIKPALNNSIIYFMGRIDRNDPHSFADHSELVNYLQNRLLPNCEFSRDYVFCIDFRFDEIESSKAASVTASILQMPQLCKHHRPFNITIWFENIVKNTPVQLPVEAIVNWLNQKSESGSGMKAKGQNKERSLTIWPYIHNETEDEHYALATLGIYDHLKKVNFILEY